MIENGMTVQAYGTWLTTLCISVDNMEILNNHIWYLTSYDTRQKRNAGREGQQYQVQLDVHSPKTWSYFISHENNKYNLANSYTCCSFTPGWWQIGGGGVETVYVINKQELASCLEADSFQEVVYSRIMLHAVAAAENVAQ